MPSLLEVVLPDEPLDEVLADDLPVDHGAGRLDPIHHELDLDALVEKMLSLVPMTTTGRGDPGR